MKNWFIYQIKSFIYYWLFKEVMPSPKTIGVSTIDEKGEIILTKPTEIRQQELCDKFKKSHGWPDHDVEFRIAEKERDAEIQLSKIHTCLDNLLVNTSLLAVPNDKLVLLSKKLNEVVLLVDAESGSR